MKSTLSHLNKSNQLPRSGPRGYLRDPQTPRDPRADKITLPPLSGEIRSMIGIRKCILYGGHFLSHQGNSKANGGWGKVLGFWAENTIFSLRFVWEEIPLSDCPPPSSLSFAPLKKKKKRLVCLMLIKRSLQVASKKTNTKATAKQLSPKMRTEPGLGSAWVHKEKTTPYARHHLGE